MTNREKILLQIMICVGVVGGIAVYMLLPKIKESRTLSSQYSELSVQTADMQAVLDTPGIVEGMEKAQKEADEMWSYFNGPVNSYNIDDMINELVKKNNLTIFSLNISKYEEYSDETLVPAKDNTEVSEDGESEEEEESRLLLGSTVVVNVSGKYEDVLQFIDDLNATTPCIDITRFDFQKQMVAGLDEEGNDAYVYEGDVTADINLILYSLKQFEMEEASSEADETSEEEGTVW